MSQYQEFIKSHIGDLAHQNYKYVEILLGNRENINRENITKVITFPPSNTPSEIDTSITAFNTKLKKDTYFKILNFFKDKLRNIEPNFISNKIYLYDNLQLSINDKYQPRCFKKFILGHDIVKHKDMDLLLNFSEKKMIPINRFENRFKYESELMKKSISYNIKKKFFLNFSEIHDLEGNYYNISFLITKKNGKSNEVIKLLEMYLNVIEELM